MKSLLVLFLSFGLNFIVLSQNLVDITIGGSYAFTNTTNVISTNFGGTGVGIGWSANLYSDAEMGPTNELLSLRWMIDYAATTAGDSYTMNNVSIWLFESGTNTVFTSIARPNLIANEAVNVFQGDLVFTPPAQSTPNHCEADVQFTTPFQYNTGNSLVVYVEKLTPYVGGPVSPYYGYMPGASGLRVLSNWSGTAVTPLLPNANNGQQDRYALIKFNETDPADLCTQSPCNPGIVSGSTTLCAGTNDATVSISNPNNENVQWQQLVNGVWEDIPGANSNSLTVNNLILTTQYQAVVSSAACATATSAIVTINVSPIVSPPEIGSVNQPICPATTGSVSFINLPTPGTWTIVGDPGGEIITGSGTTGLMENLSPGNYTFSINWNGCSSEFSAEIVTIETPQTATPIATNNDFNACLSDQATVNNLPVSFTGTPTIELQSTPAFIVVTGTDLLVNGNYYISQTDNTNGCSPSDTIVIAVTIQASQVPQIANSSFTLCESEASTVADLNATGNGGILNYYFSNGTTVTAVNTTDLLQSGTYFVTQTGPANACESIDSLEITVAIGTTPPPTTANSNQEFCVIDNATVNDLDVNAGTNTLNYFFDNGTSIVVVALTDVLLEGNYYITATDPNTNCTSTDSLDIGVTLNDTPAPNTSAATFEACVTDLATVNDLPATFTGTPNITLENPPNFIPVTGTDILVNGNYSLSQTDPVTGCLSSEAANIEVTIQESQVPQIANDNLVFCESEAFTVADIGATGNGGVLNYYFSNGTTVTAVNTTDILQTGTYFVTQTGPANACESIDSLEITVAIGTTPPPTTANANQEFCVIDNATVNDLDVNAGTNTLNYFFDNGTSIVSVATTAALLVGNYYIIATDPNTNCTSSDSLVIAVILNDTPAPNSSAATFEACVTDLATVNDLPVTFTGTPNITLENPPNFIPVIGTDILVNGNYSLSQTDPVTGCLSSEAANIEVTIQESQVPQVANNSFTLCESDGSTVADLGVSGNGGVLNYYFSDGVNMTAVNTTALLLTGTYFVTQTGPANACESIDSLEITVAIGTTPPPTTANANQEFCVIDNPTVNDLDVNAGTNTLNYFFDNGTSIVSVATTAALLVGNYYIIATDPNTNCTSTDSLVIGVDLNDSPPPTSTAPSQVFCATDGATLNDLVVIGDDIQWYDSNENLLASTTLLVTNSSYFASQTTGANGCESSGTLEIEVTILDPPAPLSNFLTQDFCEDANATIDDFQATGANIQWYDAANNGNLIAPNTPLTNGQTYFASQIIDGCESSSFLAITANIQTIIDGGFMASDSIGCSPFNIQLTPNYINPNATYNWYINDEFTANATILDYTFTNTGCYDIQLTITEENSCFTDVTNADLICVSPAPNASFFANPNTLVINNQLVTFQNTSSNAESFLWDFGDGTSSNQTNPETNINIINEYQTITLTAVSIDGCESMASLVLEMPENDLYVPNSFTPDADEHNQSWGPVFLSGFDKYNFQVLVFNRWGEIVWESLDANGRWDGKYSNKQLTCPEGIYTWKIIYKKKNSDDRIVRTGHITLIR